MLTPILLLAATLHGSAGAPAETEVLDPLAPEVVHAAVAADLTPSALAASGLTVEQAQAMGDRLAAEPDVLQSLLTAQSAASAAALSVGAAWAAIAQNPADAGLLDDLHAAQAAHEQAAGQIRAAIESARAIALDGAPATAAARLDAFRAVPGDLPAELRVVAWTPEQAEALRAALVAERRALRAGTGVPAGAAALLTDARSLPAVVEASAALAARLGSMSELLAAP